MHSDRGGQHLCSFEMQMWGMVYTVALEWNTFVIFRWDRMHVPDKLDGLVSFFVPKDATHRYEICEFLEGHLKKIRRDASESGKFGYWPGVKAVIHCTIYTFDGANPERPAGSSDAMIKEFTKNIMLDLGGPKRRERIANQARQKLIDDPSFGEKLIGSLLPSRLEELLKKGDQ